MKLHTATYKSPYPTQGTFENIYIEDVSYRINRIEKLLVIKFQMYYEVDSKRIVLDENQLSFKGSNSDLSQGLPNSNKTAYIKVYNPDYNPEIPQTIEVPNPNYDENIPITIEIANPDYDENIEGSLPTISIPNPEYILPTMTIVNPDYIVESYETPLLEYLYSHEGQMPEQYEVIEWGYPTYEDALNYFEGGTLDNPELSITNPFAKEWLKQNLQMKGEAITQFEFI